MKKYEVKNISGDTVRAGEASRMTALMRFHCVEKREGYAELWIDGELICKTK